MAVGMVQSPLAVDLGVKYPLDYPLHATPALPAFLFNKR
jgi:hypothetical protein